MTKHENGAALNGVASSDLLSAREVELVHGMIQVQLRHADQCDSIQNRPMAQRQKGLDMERVALLRKVLRAMGG